MTDTLKGVRTRNVSTPQMKQADPRQVKNAAGGYVFKISDMDRVKRFLIVGAADGYYTSGKQLADENFQAIQRLVANDDTHRELVDLLTEVSVEGRAPKVNPVLFTLAVAASDPASADAKAYALSKLNDVARTATHLFIFVSYVEQFRGWGRALRRAVAAWYTSKTVDQVAYQAVKYQSREGWSHRDVFRQAHPRSDDPAFRGLGEWILRGDYSEAPRLVQGFKAAQAEGADIPALIREYGLTWEMVPTASLNEVATWEALFEGSLPLGALIRQLPRLTRIGFFKDFSEYKAKVAARLTDVEELRKARIHPLNVLLAQKTYAEGRSLRGESSWTPVQEIAAALDKAFYLAFKTIEPANKRTMIGVDVSGSMGSRFSDLPISSSEAAGALALVTMATEPKTLVYGFDRTIRELRIDPSMRLDQVMKYMISNTFGATDTSALIRKALKDGTVVDTFIVITDNDTWYGSQHTHEALKEYRTKVNPQARLIVMATYASAHSVADPDDPLSLDVAGFDSATPALISAFSRGL